MHLAAGCLDRPRLCIEPRAAAHGADAMCVLLLMLLLIMAFGATTTTLPAAAAAHGERPCDILAAAGNPCVAAHSTVRALFANFSGPLYNLSKPDGTSKTIGVTASGYADSAAHDAFCGPAKDCVVYNIFDQSPMRNHLGPRHKLVNASLHPIVAGGQRVYGLWFDRGYGYHVDNTTGIATGNQPESIFAVMSGTHYNDGCCFVRGCAFCIGSATSAAADMLPE
eukprot:SAG31_NODE_9859_length_1219_cov_7.760243_2_plen_223_part_01